MAFDLFSAFNRTVERTTKIEEGELYIRKRNGQKEYVRKRKSVTKQHNAEDMCNSCGGNRPQTRRSSRAQKEAELVAQKQKLEIELTECREREQRARIGFRERRPYHYSGGKMKFDFDFEMEEREPNICEPVKTETHCHEHVHHHHHRRPSQHHHQHVHYPTERRASYVRERPVHVRRPSYCDDSLLYQRVVVDRRRRRSADRGYRVVVRNFVHQQPELWDYEERSPDDYYHCT